MFEEIVTTTKQYTKLNRLLHLLETSKGIDKECRSHQEEVKYNTI